RASPDPQHPAQSRRHRHFAGDLDLDSPVLPGCGAARLACAGDRSLRVTLAAIKPLALSLRQSRDGMILTVRLTPKSTRDEVVGIEDHAGEGVLKGRGRALPPARRPCGGPRTPRPVG